MYQYEIFSKIEHTNRMIQMLTEKSAYVFELYGIKDSVNDIRIWTMNASDNFHLNN